MKKFLLLRKNDFIHDRLQWISSLIAVTLACCHCYQFIDSGFMTECLIKLIFCSVYPFFTFIFGRNFFFWFYFLYGLALTQIIKFDNYSAFILMVLCCIYKPKYKYPVLILYAIGIIIICTRNDKSAVHILIHFLNCFCIYITARYLVKDKFKKPKLNLADDEKKILDLLAAGQQQKSIDFLSKNTVTKKLHEAMSKNNCDTKQELITRYINEFKL